MATTLVHKRPSNRGYATVDLSTTADGVSSAIDISDLLLTSIQMSTAWTDAGLGFQGNVDGSTNYYSVFTSSGDYLVLQTSANRIVSFSPSQFANLQKLRLVSETTAGVAVAQASARVIKLGLFGG